MKMLTKSFIIGMSSAFNLFPQNNLSKLPFQVTIDGGQFRDALALHGDIKKINGDFQKAIEEIKAKEKIV